MPDGGTGARRGAASMATDTEPVGSESHAAAGRSCCSRNRWRGRRLEQLLARALARSPLPRHRRSDLLGQPLSRNCWRSRRSELLMRPPVWALGEACGRGENPRPDEVGEEASEGKQEGVIHRDEQSCGSVAPTLGRFLPLLRR